jgi:iron complex outermembrane receptor protein
VYPQEYVDQENTCSEFVTQGSTDVDSPQVGASGGNFGIVTCNPENNERLRVMQTLGQLNMYKTFVRYDTGLLADKRSKAFISVSQARADKWKGNGQADRKHVDAGFNYDWDRFNYVHATLLWNDADNNSINNLTLKEINDFGYFYDTSSTFPGHLPAVKGTAQDESKIAPSPLYYGLYRNPFKNGIFSATANFRLSDNTDLKIVPYYWYGFGAGGLGQKNIKEAGTFMNAGTLKNTGAVDLNGDGDTLDTVIMYSESVTRTNRPGVTLSLTHRIGDHTLLGGVWYERATHKQTGPMVPVTQAGEPVDPYAQEQQVHRPDGTLYEARDSKTISTAYQAFFQDTFTLGEKATFNLGVRTPFIKRDVTNYANEGNLYGTYNLVRTYHSLLPQLGARYRITNDDQLFASIAKNMKAPANFVFTNTGSNVLLNPSNVPTLRADVKEETSWNTDIGYRHQDSKYIATLTVFDVNFKNRQGNAFIVETGNSTYTNIGNVRNRGFEIEANNMPINGWSFYTSVGFQTSELLSDQNFASSRGGLLHTAGKEMTNTPRWKGGLSAEYSNGPFMMRAKVKATSRQMATLMNDEIAPGYTTFGIDGAYTFANVGYLKRPKLQWNISNIFNKQYRNPSSNSATNALLYDGVTSTSVPRYYLGAPRYASVTFSVDL